MLNVCNDLVFIELGVMSDDFKGRCTKNCHGPSELEELKFGSTDKCYVLLLVCMGLGNCKISVTFSV